MFKKVFGLTLIELIISIIIMFLIIVGIYNIETFSSSQVIDSDHRAKVQNELTYVLEHMSKYIQQANGDKNNPPIAYYPNAGAPTGFKVRYDCNAIQTSSDLTDDVWVYYTLSGNTLSTGCIGANCGSCSADRSVPPTGAGEVLSSKILANFHNIVMPVNPADGFYAYIDPLGNLVDIGLVGRYDPTKAVISGTRFANPQIEMETKIICNSSSSY